MRIGVILPHLKKYGGVRRYLEFGNQLIQRGHEYSIFLSDMTPEDWSSELHFQGVLKPANNLPSESLDACICGDAGSLSLLDLAHAKLKIVNVIFPPFAGYLLGDYKHYLTESEFLVVGNSTGWEGPLEVQPHWRTIPGAVNLDMFRPHASTKHKNFKILFMAKKRPWKGLEQILEAYARLKSEPGLEWGYFDTEVHDLPKIKPHINLPQKSMAKLYSNYDVFISAETLAGWQNCAAEAMACGLPVITTQIGSRDFAIHGETAFIAENVDDLVTSILFLKKNKQIAQKLAKAGRLQIQNYSWEIYTDKWLEFLSQELSKCIEIQTDNKLVESYGENVMKDIFGVLPEEVKIEQPKVIEKSIPIVSVKDAMLNAMREKSKRLKQYYEIANRLDVKTFDKYERLGAYHWASTDPVYKAYIDFLKKIFEGISTFYGFRQVLDVGGGDGYIASVLAELGFPVYLIDLNETAIKLATAKLSNNPKIKISREDFFSLKDVPGIVLMSQIIEHFEYPETVVAKLMELQPHVLIVTTPIQKDAGMWDSQYHYQEFAEQDFIDLFQPLFRDYTISYYALAPYNQFLIFEKKSEALATYFKNLIEHEKINLDLVPDMVETVLSLASNEIKRV
jgi:glycosyltransferase involved in cell wall biosynthesis/SAM-dependent methyltransferase